MSEPFYKDGLRFECTRCSRCCRHDPGYVFLSREDVDDIRQALGLARRQFLKRYSREVNLNGFKRVSLKEKKNYDCIFWQSGGCKIYEHRPLQCRSYPFWPIYLHTPSDWDQVGAACPGVGRGSLVSRTEIETWLNRQRRQRHLESGEHIDES